MNTFVSVNTRTHSITYLSDNILRSMKQLIRLVGLNPHKFLGNWDLFSLGLQTWLKSGHLTGATLEVYNTISNALEWRFDFTIDYSYGSGDDGEFWVDLTLLKNAIIKGQVDITDCNYSIIILTKPGSPDVAGFSSCDFRSTEGFIQQSVGTVIGTNYLSSNSTYWRKK